MVHSNCIPIEVAHEPRCRHVSRLLGLHKRLIHSSPLLPGMEPSDDLRQLAAKGRRILAEVRATLNSRSRMNDRISVGLAAIEYFTDPPTNSAAIKGMARAIYRGNVEGRLSNSEEQMKTWMEECKASLNNITRIRGHQMPISPNSSGLVSSFMKTQEFYGLDTRLRHAIEFLEKLAGDRLVLNSDLDSLRIGLSQASMAPTLSEANAEDRFSEMDALLYQFDSELISIRGARNAWETRGPDWQRQSLSSCRTALENLVKKLSGESEWSIGLKKILDSETKRSAIKHTHSLLSAYGSHGPSPPSEEDVEYGIGLTLCALKLLLSLRPSGQQNLELS